MTIDLLNLNSISVSADKTTTYVGSGNHWADVYTYLDPRGLAVIGGRNGEIGVGGLTLGGEKSICLLPVVCYTDASPQVESPSSLGIMDGLAIM